MDVNRIVCFTFFFMFEVWYHLCRIANDVGRTTLCLLSMDLLNVRENLVEI